MEHSPGKNMARIWSFLQKNYWEKTTNHKKDITFAAQNEGKMPEWSIGPHSKCGERVTVPRVRIPVFPLILPEAASIGEAAFFILNTSSL